VNPWLTAYLAVIPIFGFVVGYLMGRKFDRDDGYRDL
jgi:hypothetical protein